jgi:hypothetical protein
MLASWREMAVRRLHLGYSDAHADPWSPRPPMTTAVMLRDQLAELRMMVDRNDPAHVEAEATFAAMVTEILSDTEFDPKDRSLGKNPARSGALPSMPHPTENAEHRGERGERQLADPLATQLMLGTAEAYDGLEQDIERRAAAVANGRPRGGSTQRRRP